jgi:hypothetical protein
MRCINFLVSNRSIRIKSSILATRFVYLDAFLHLRSLSIVFSEGLATQHTCAKRIFDRSFPFRLESLTLTCLSRIDVPLLNIIATRFPRLISLVLSCTQRLDFKCCWACLEDSASSILHSPIPDMFSTSDDLAVTTHAFLLTNCRQMSSASPNIGRFLHGSRTTDQPHPSSPRHIPLERILPRLPF